MGFGFLRGEFYLWSFFAQFLDLALSCVFCGGVSFGSFLFCSVGDHHRATGTDILGFTCVDVSLTSCGVTFGLAVPLGSSEVFLISRRVFWVVSGQAGLVLPFCFGRGLLVILGKHLFTFALRVAVQWVCVSSRT